MGYDCTLHVVDERAVRDVMVPKLLGLSTAVTPFDRIQPDAAELWTTVRRAMEKGVDDDGDEIDVEVRTSYICRLALMFTSCALPHRYERGLALSLWPEDLEPVPDEFFHSPEPMFKAITDKYPELRGKFPEFFDGNWSTGAYVPAGKVQPVRRWVEHAISKLSKGERRAYRGLLAILKTAEARDLAYWEATDIDAQVIDVYPGKAEQAAGDYYRKLMEGDATAEKFALPGDASFHSPGAMGDLRVLSAARPDVTLLVDLARWPPTCAESSGQFVVSVDVDAKGRRLFTERSGPGDEINPYRAVLRSDPRGKALLTVDLPDGLKLDRAYLVDGRAVLIPDPGDRQDAVGTQVRAWMHDGAKTMPAPGLPPHTVRPSSVIGNEKIVHRIFRLAGGAEVLVWDGQGYEWNGKAFEATFPLKFTGGYDDHSAVPVGDDGVYVLSDRKLFEAHRGRPPVHLATKWGNIMGLAPGPAGGLLLREGDNDDGDLGKLIFPADESFIHLEPEQFGNEEFYEFLCWSEPAGRIIAGSGRTLYAVKTETILNLPRHPAPK